MTNSLAKRAALYIGILAFALVLLLFLGAGQASADPVSGDITNDTLTWTNGSVYNVTGDVNIIGNLTIEENVTVVFEGNYNFNVIGSLAVEGTAANPVIFTWNDSLGTYWGYLMFAPGSSGTLNFLNISHSSGIYLDNVSVPISNVNAFDVTYGIYANFYGDVEQDIVLEISDFSVTSSFVAVSMTNNNGSMDITLERFIVDDCFAFGGWGAAAFSGNGTVNLNLIDLSMNNTYYGLGIEADKIGAVKMVGCSFTNITDDDAISLYDASGDMSLIVEGAVFENIWGSAIYVESDVLVYFELANSTFNNIGVNTNYYCVYIYSDEGDMEFVMNNVTMYDFYVGFYVTTNNGSIMASLSEVHTDNCPYWLGGLYAYSLDNSSRLDLAITDSTFNNSDYGLWIYSETSGSVSMSNVEFTGVYRDGALTVDYETAVRQKGDLSIEMTNVLMDDVVVGIDPAIEGNISLVLESVTMNNTGELGWFRAYNADNTAVIDVTMNNCVFSNSSYGFYFEADTLGDFEITNTVFSSIDYYVISMTLGYGDVLIPIEGVEATGIGSFLDLAVTFGNVELVITDSMLEGNYAPGQFLIDVVVNSNTLDNGFITLTVVNSTFKNASGGIRTWSEELNPIDLTTTLFENITGDAMHFDVRSGDLDFTFADDDVTVVDAGIGLWAYANNGNINLDFSGVHFNTTQYGVFLEVSSLDPYNLTVINMEINDSVFADGGYGIYALSLNGGTVTIDGSQFLGHSMAGYWFDSLYGEMDVEITDSVFDGSSAADWNSYLVAEVDNTFQLIGRNYWTMGVDAWNIGLQPIDLPFAFDYMGVEYTQVVMSEDGWIGFAPGQEIMPVGDTNLIYNYEQFFGYKVAEDNMSVMFHWYASGASYGGGLSSAFQVVLFADGSIQFNYADMEVYSILGPMSEYGLRDGGDVVIDLLDITGLRKHEVDWNAYLFTPLSISDGMGALLSMEEGNITAVITNNTVSGYYNGGIAVASLNGGLDLEVTGNDFSKIVGDEFAALDIYDFNGATELVMADNTFERIWGLAIRIILSSTEGGEKVVDMSDSVFNDVRYVLYSVIGVNDGATPVSTGNDSLDVTVNFQNNVMTNAYGLYCGIELYLYDPVNWTVTVVQTMTDNVMVEEAGLMVLPWSGWIPNDVALGSPVYIEQLYQDQNSVTLEQTATVTGNHIEFPGDDGIQVGNEIYNYYGDTIRNAVIDVSNNLLNISGDDGIEVWSEMYTAVGNIVDDTRITIENNQVNDGNQYTDAILVYVGVDSEAGVIYDQSSDADITTYISVSDNLVEGAYLGIYAEIWYYQDQVAGDWNVALTSHMDRNQLLNVSGAVDAYLWAGPWFYNNYWPPENETAVANFVMDYLYTVDDNVVTDYYVDFSEMIYVEIEYWAGVQTGTVSLAAQTYAWITGAISISGNEIVLDEDVDGIYLYHYTEAGKSSWIWVDVDVAVDNNVLEAIADSDGDYSAEDAIYIDSETSVWSNDYVITLNGATVDMTWSVTGNEIVGFEYGIYVDEEVDVDYGMSSIEYAMVWDISGNEMTDITDTGVDYEFDRDDGNTYGTIEMSVGVTIDNNIISLTDRDDTYYGIYLDSWANGVSSWEYWDEQYGNHTFVASVSGNTISHAEYGLYIYGTLYLDVPSDYVLTGEEVFYTYVNDITVENNLIEDCWTGMYLEDTMNVRNNVIDCGIGAPTWGVYWYEADGELVGNTITADYAVEVYYLHTLLVQGNLIQFGATGIYVYDYDEEDPYEMEPNGTIVDNTLTALYNPFLPDDSYGIELYDVFNVLISGNAISGADYGVDLNYVWNVNVTGNEISGASDSGIYVYDAWLVWIESNTVTGCYNGLYVSSENEDLVVGNNTFVANSYAIYMYADITRMVLWNNVFVDNEYGVDVYSYRYLEVVWYVDAQSRSSRSDIDINAPIFVLAGGSLVLEDMELDVWSDYDNARITVDEGGLLSMSNVYVDEIDLIDVAGTFWASLSVFDETYVYLGPTAEAEIRTSVFDESRLVVDGCAPVIADNLFDGQYNWDVIAITIVNGAAPSIVSNVIIDYDIGIYANGMDMGGIYDNLIMSNNRAGLLVESCTGTIHDNIILENEVAILLRNSDVSVENNEIGYTDLFQVMANYATLLSLISETSEPGEVTYDLWDSLDTILAYSSFDIRSLYDWVTDHTYGIWAEGSTVRTSGNTYGLLSYAVYAIDSEVHFSDDIRTTEIVIPWVVIGENYVERYNYTADVYTLNGIYAARSDVYVSDCVIEVVDDALTFEASNAWVEGATLMAGDFDYFVFGGSDVYNIATTYAKAKVMDSHSLNEGTWLTLTFLDKGKAAANISVLIKNAKGEIVFNGTTDADGKVKLLLTQYSYTSEGKDDGFNPYTIIADFESGEKSTKVVLDQSYQDLTIEGEEESDMGAILAVVGVLVIILLIVAAVVVMRRRK